MASEDILKTLFGAFSLLLVLCLPFINDVGQHNDHHGFDVSIIHHGNGALDDPSKDDEHKDIGHASTHCLTASCAPASFTLPNFMVDPGRGFFKEKFLKNKALNVRPFYLAGDPPVPRGGFSNT